MSERAINNFILNIMNRLCVCYRYTKMLDSRIKEKNSFLFSLSLFYLLPHSFTPLQIRELSVGEK